MDTIEAIYSRRSIRHFTKQEISDSIIHELINAAIMAPSAGNQQSWHFIIIRERTKLEQIADEHIYAKMLKNANAAIAVCSETALEKYPGNYPLDCSAATQNILLAAHNYGIGSVWIGIYPKPERQQMMQRICSIPSNIIPVSLVGLGYPNEEKGMPKRIIEGRIHLDNW